MHRLALDFSLLSLVALALPQSVAAQERVVIPVRSANAIGERIALEAFVYRAVGSSRAPIVVLSHGSAAGAPRNSLPARELASYFVSHGFAVIVPMRRGRGTSTGVSREYEDRHCEPSAWEPGLRDAMEDLSASIDYAGAMPDVDTSRVVLAGVSRGGFLSVAYAAEGARRRAVVGVVNFVGAWIAQREDQCPQDFNALAFGRFGRETHVPMIWLYGDADPFNTTSDIRGYAARFRQAGGNVVFNLFENVPGNGHALAETPSVWRDSVDGFLRRLADRRAPSSRTSPPHPARPMVDSSPR